MINSPVATKMTTYVLVVVSYANNLPEIWLIDKTKISDEVWDAMVEEENAFPSWCTEDDNGQVLFDLRKEAVNADATTLIAGSGPVGQYSIERILRYVV